MSDAIELANAQPYEADHATYLASLDAETAAVYEAESEFRQGIELSIWNEADEDLAYSYTESLTAAQAEAEAVEILSRAGYENPQVTVELVVWPAEMRNGFYDPVRNVIGGFVEPIGIGRNVLMHELAHWMRPRVGHGPQFRAAHATLVGIVFGRDTAAELVGAYEDHGLTLDEFWFNQSRNLWTDLLVRAA